MTRYRIAGTINLLLGLLETIYSLLYMFFAIPRMYKLYANFNAEVPPPVASYLVLTLVLLLGIANLFLGIKLFSSSSAKDWYFKFAIILIVISLSSYLVFTLYSVILPIYSLTSNF